MPTSQSSRRTKRSRRQRGGEGGRTLIISSGDASDFDGYLALPIYMKAAALKGNTDIAFVMNYPQYLKSNNARPDTEQYKTNPGIGYDYDVKYLCSKRKDFEDIISKNKHPDESIDTMTTDRMNTIIENSLDEVCSKIISLFADAYKATDTNVFYVKGGYNSINPFGATKETNPWPEIKNEIAVYGNSLETVTVKDVNVRQNILELLDNYQYIYIDMNGSMAWYTAEISKYFNTDENKSKVKGIYIMGGVLSDSKVNTMGAGPNLNRLSCATMNQLYHPENTFQFLQDFQDHPNIFVVSNNEINANFCFLESDRNYSSKQTYIYNDFKNVIKNLNLIPIYDSSIINKAFDAFYESRPGDRKLFDVIPALVLASDMMGRVSATINNQHYLNLTQLSKHHLAFNNIYGITLLNKQQITNIPNVIKSYIEKGISNKPGLDSEIQLLTTKTEIQEINNWIILPVINVFGQREPESKHDNSTNYVSAIKTLMDSSNSNKMIDLNLQDTFAWPILVPASGGARKSQSSPPQPSEKRVEIGGRKRVVYVGKRGAEYVKMNKEFVPIKAALKSAKKSSSASKPKSRSSRSQSAKK